MNMKRFSILVLILVVGIFMMSGAMADPAYSGNIIYQCGSVDVPGVYVLNQSIYSYLTCLSIDSDNVIIDGLGNGVEFYSEDNSYAVLLTGDRNNVTIKNMIISNSGSAEGAFGFFGIYSAGQVNSSFFINNTINVGAISGNAGGGISFNFGKDLNLTNNIIYSNRYEGVAISYSENMTFFSNNITSYATGFVLGNSFYDNIVNNTIISSGSYGIYGINLENINISNNVINSGLLGSIFIYSSCSNIFLFNNSFSYGEEYGFFELGADSLPLFFSNLMGKILFLNKSFGADFNILWGTDIQINNNFVYVNSSIDELNKSANVTLYNTGINNSTKILRDGAVCDDSICTNLTEIELGNYTFSVTGWSNYSIQEMAGPAIHLFPIANSTAYFREVVFNVSDDSNISSCYVNVSTNIALYVVNQSAINISSNNTKNITDLGIGEHIVSVFCDDQFGNTGYSNNVTFNVTEEPVVVETPSSGGSTSSIFSLFVPDATFENGFTKNIGRGSSLKFKVENKTHSVLLNNISNSSITITVQSAPQVFTMKVGDIINVDVNNDSVKDVEISYLKYYASFAQIKIREVSIPYKVNVGGVEVVDSVVNEEIEVIDEEKDYTNLIVAISVVIVAMVVFVLLRLSNKKRR
jgi:parallel beta-helix repeat protein